MRKRPPSFTLVLSALVAAAALAIVLAGQRSSQRPTTGQPPTVGIGPARACVTTSAEAQSDNRSAIVITATVQTPVTVTEQASGPRGIATVTRSEVVRASVKANQPVEAKRTVGVRVRACADADSGTAAKTAALRAAYAHALASAHAVAARQASEALQRLLHSEYPIVAANAQARAAAQSRRLALAAEASLEAEAKAQARRQAGD